MDSTLRVGVLGAGAWARNAHIPGWQRDPRCEVVAICDVDRERAEAYAEEFGIPDATDDWQALVSRADIDVIDVVTPSHTHYELACGGARRGQARAVREAGGVRLSPDARRAAGWRARKGLKTKLGFTFRYSPGVQYARELLDEGFVGTPFIFNGYEQNSQWLDPQVPLRQVDPNADQSVLQTSSLEGYGAPIIDIGHWWVGADFARVVGTMRNFIPERMVRATGQMMRMNIDDGDIFIGEYTNGAIGSIQTSFVTIGNYPGIEARIYGERAPSSAGWSRSTASPRRSRVATPGLGRVRRGRDPAALLSAGRARARIVAVAVLRQPDQATSSTRFWTGGERNQGNFEDGAWVQEVINAVELSFHQRRWVDLPLPARLPRAHERRRLAPAFGALAGRVLCRLLPTAAGQCHVHRRARVRRALPDLSEAGARGDADSADGLLASAAQLPPKS